MYFIRFRYIDTTTWDCCSSNIQTRFRHGSWSREIIL